VQWYHSQKETAKEKKARTKLSQGLLISEGRARKTGCREGVKTGGWIFYSKQKAKKRLLDVRTETGKKKREGTHIIRKGRKKETGSPAPENPNKTPG